MTDTGFRLSTSKREHMVPVYQREASGVLKKFRDDEAIGSLCAYRAWQWFGPVTLYSGGGGLASTASDYWRFSQMLLNLGQLQNKRVLAPATVLLATSDQLKGVTERAPTWRGISGYVYGVAVAHSPASSGTVLPRGSYDWSGGLGTQFWIDPEHEIVAIFMTQSIPHALAWDVERLQAIVYGALIER